MQGKKNVLEEVFSDFLNRSGVFKNREVLRHDYIPESLPHREEQVRYLGEVLAPLLRGGTCSNVFVYGKTGTGKTAVTRFVLSRLAEKAAMVGSTIRVCYLNCRLVGTEYRVLTNLCSSLGVVVPFTGLAVGEILDRFKEGLDSQSLVLVVVLDEIDALVKERGDALLYELTRINEGLKKSRVVIMGISNDLRFKELLDPRVLSTLSEEEIVFKPYNADELLDILRDRADMAFASGGLAEGTLRLCAALAAAEHGDARRALDLLRVAGELAERSGVGRTSEQDVRNAQKRIEHDRVTEAVKSLPTHSKVVLLSAYLFGKFNVSRSITGDIYNLYCELCEQVGLGPLTQRRVSGLINELDVIGLLNSRVVSLGRYGRTRKTSLGVSQNVIRQALFEDERLRVLSGYSPRYLASS